MRIITPLLAPWLAVSVVTTWPNTTPMGKPRLRQCARRCHVKPSRRRGVGRGDYNCEIGAGMRSPVGPCAAERCRDRRREREEAHQSDAPAPVSGAVQLGQVVCVASVELKVIAGGCDEDTFAVP